MLGIDLGSVRIGIALSDPSRTVASPHSVVRRSRDHATDHRAILEMVRAEEVTAIVVGLPLSMSGASGPRGPRRRSRDRRAASGGRRRHRGFRARRALDHRYRRTQPRQRAHEARPAPGGRRQGGRGRDAAIVVGPTPDDDRRRRRRRRQLRRSADRGGAYTPDSGVRRRARRRADGRVTAVVLVLILVPVVVLGVGIGWFWYQLGGESSGAKVQVHLERGWGVSQVADELAKKHVVRSALAFNIYARFNGENSFQAGTYDLREIARREGARWTRSRRARTSTTSCSRSHPASGSNRSPARVAALGGGRSAADLPRRHAQQRGAIDLRARRRLESRGPAAARHLQDLGVAGRDRDPPDAGEDLRRARRRSLGLATANVQGHTAYDIIKVASIIEAEAKVDQDRQLIASVIYNRLAANMPLQIDATVLYAARGSQEPEAVAQGSRDQVAVQHVPQCRLAAHADRGGERQVAAGGDGPGGDRLPVLRARGQGRPSRVLVDRGTVATGCRRGAGAGLAVIVATTRVAAVIGDPVRHSLSPRLHNAAYRASGSRLGARRVRDPRRRRARGDRRRCGARPARLRRDHAPQDRDRGRCATSSRRMPRRCAASTPCPCSPTGGSRATRPTAQAFSGRSRTPT